MRKEFLVRESEILDLYFERNEKAISETASLYGDAVMKISRNILKNESDSEENENDTYVSLWNSIPPQRPQSLIAYISKTARNLALNKLDKRNTLKRSAHKDALSIHELDECTPSNLSVENDADSKLLSETISKFLRSEREDARNIFIRRYFFCDSVKDIAELLSLSESKVKSSLMRTRGRLKDHLLKEGFIIE